MKKISAYASEIEALWPGWRKSPASAYLNAMDHIESQDSEYLYETGRGVVLGFLANASGFRGEAARRIKGELKAMLG